MGWGKMVVNGSTPTTNTTLYTSFESYVNNLDDRYGLVYSGWFTAPVTANYRFFVAADDTARVYMDKTNPYNPDSPVEPTMELIAYDDKYVGYRNYFVENNGQISEWIALEEGKSYLMEGQHIDHNGNEYFTASVEIDVVPENHPKPTK